MRGGDFSTPLRFGRNDERVACCHRHLERGCMPLWETDRNRSHDTLSREISCRNAARTMRGGDFSTLWRLCIESPSQPKLASSLHNKRLSYWRLTGYGRNDGRVRAGFFIICGEAATTTLGAKGPVKLKNPPAHRGRSILRTFFTTFFYNPSTQPAAEPRPFLIAGTASSRLSAGGAEVPGRHVEGAAEQFGKVALAGKAAGISNVRNGRVLVFQKGAAHGKAVLIDVIHG